jgi:hypothetical protein
VGGAIRVFDCPKIVITSIGLRLLHFLIFILYEAESGTQGSDESSESILEGLGRRRTEVLKDISDSFMDIVILGKCIAGVASGIRGCICKRVRTRRHQLDRLACRISEG